MSASLEEGTVFMLEEARDVVGVGVRGDGGGHGGEGSRGGKRGSGL